MRCTLLLHSILLSMLITSDSSGRTTSTIDDILPGGSERWQVAYLQPNDSVPQLGEIDGTNVLVVGKHRRLTVSAKQPYQSPREYHLRFRYASTRGSIVSVIFADLNTTTPDAHRFTVSAHNSAKQIICSLHNHQEANKRKRSRRVGLALNPAPKRQLNWDEDFRKRVEHSYGASRALTEQWFELRIRVLPDRITAAINDRQFGEWPREDRVGSWRVELSGDAQLAQVTESPIADPRFYPVGLEHDLNAARIGGNEIGFDARKARFQYVNDVPFLFPKPDDNGNNHVDVGKSWFKSGMRSGYLQTMKGPFGGRWNDAFAQNPSRLQFAVPKGSYHKLHLIATVDQEPDSFPKLSAQFYAPKMGRPRNYESEAVVSYPVIAKKVKRQLPLKLGRKQQLYHVTIPVDPDQIAQLSELTESHYLGLELTKKIKLYRSYPDPISYSHHAGGLPSAVRVFAMSLQRPSIEAEIVASQFAGVWTAPAKPSFQVRLHNHTAQIHEVRCRMFTDNDYGERENEQELSLTILPGQSKAYDVELTFEKYGTQWFTCHVSADGETQEATRRFVYLHPDTRTRGGWQPGQGGIYGHWSHWTGHRSPPVAKELPVMAQAGCETLIGTLESARVDEETATLAKSLHYKTYNAFTANGMYEMNNMMGNLRKGMPVAEARNKFAESMKKWAATKSEISEPLYVNFFPEPGIGPISHACLPTYYGEPEHKLSETEQKKFNEYARVFRETAKFIRQNYPGTKNKLPYGDPLFIVPFLRSGDQELIDLIDGQALDSPFFERVPESQAGQVTLHRIWQMHQEWEKIGKKPVLSFNEGNCVPTLPGGVTFDEQKNYIVRNLLHLLAYGVTDLYSGVCSFDASSYYGEEHYGCGYLLESLPHRFPKPSFVSFATLTRHLNRKNFITALPTGSHSVFCLKFKHYEKSEFTYVLWTIRGTRDVQFHDVKGRNFKVYDAMDNPTALSAAGASFTIRVDASPQYLEGLTADPQMTLSAPDHSDNKPGPHARHLTNLGDGSWQLRAEADERYANNHPLQNVRFLGKMSAKQTSVDAKYGGRAMAVQFGQQEKVRLTMPWYNLLVPKQAITIPGKASHLGLWVKANSDWGRVVYFLRDANGEQWISIGTKEQWNCDDIHAKSQFNFDGWRYLKFALPANAPYDSYRENGSTWWGHFGNGDGIVDLPLQLEKMAVERRSHVMYVNKPVPANTDDVLLGDLVAEYQQPSDQGSEAIRLSRLRMPVPEGMPELDNPILAMASDGTLEATQITKIEEPLHHRDGTRCDVFFETVENAKSYHIWASPYRDGRGALVVGKNWTAPGKRIQGLKPEMDFYLFVSYVTNDGKHSKPSAPFNIKLKDLFHQK